MDNKNSEFSYTYSAKEQNEIRRIREKYCSDSSDSEDKMARLLKLDAGVTQKAQIISLMFGVIGTLVMGFGMSLIMSNLASFLGLSENMAMVIGVGIGAVGGVLVCLAYPMYNLVIKHERKKIASEIIKLTDELMK